MVVLAFQTSERFSGKVEWSKNMPVHSFIQQTYEAFQAVLPVVQTLQCEQRKDTLL